MDKIFRLSFILALFFVACDEEGAKNDVLALSEEAIDAEVAIEETEAILDDIVLYSESAFGISETSTSKSNTTSKGNGPDRHGHSKFFKNCADITVDRTDVIITTVITFNGECEDKNGDIITGTITKVRTLSDASKTKTVTFTDLSINGRLVNGVKEYTFTEANDNDNPEMTGSVDITIETADGTVSKVGSRTVEITAGGDTYFWFDDEKTITGSCTYINADGDIFSVEITTALVKPAGCKYIASGIKEYTKAEETTTLDFGDGTCDNVATKTAADGTVTEIKLRKKRKR